jgi:hypothetical protein
MSEKTPNHVKSGEEGLITVARCRIEALEIDGKKNKKKN